ncbi:MAG: hypothetical protein NUV96_02730 [Candidatus Colwellbacteria bacterium]|nr:hypothetical protein [Candidatus Colwellbacteria bacterium]
MFWTAFVLWQVHNLRFAIIFAIVAVVGASYMVIIGKPQHEEGRRARNFGLSVAWAYTILTVGFTAVNVYWQKPSPDS